MTDQQQRNWIKVFKLNLPKLSNKLEHFVTYDYINRLFYMHKVKSAYLYSATYPGSGETPITWHYPKPKNKKQTACFLYAVLVSRPIEVQFSCVCQDGIHIFIKTKTVQYLL